MESNKTLADSMWRNIRQRLLDGVRELARENDAKLSARYAQVYDQPASDAVHEWLEQRMTSAFDAALASLSDDCELILTQPTTTMTEFTQMYCRELLAVVGLATFPISRGRVSLGLNLMLDRLLMIWKRCLRERTLWMNRLRLMWPLARPCETRSGFVLSRSFAVH